MAIEIQSSQATLQLDRGNRGTTASRNQKEEGSVVSPFSRAAESSVNRVQQTDEADSAKEQQSLGDSENLAKLTEMLNEQPQVRNRSLQFSVHEATGRMLVRVYDSETDELIRQFPPEELLLIAERMQELLDESPSGVILQEKA